jgi:hypothetical protein
MMKQSIMKSIGVFFLLCIAATGVVGQDNNASINEDLKAIWNGGNGEPSSDIYPIGSSATEADPGLGGGTDNVADAPVDGGISLLLAAGLGYGVKRIRRRGKKKNTF